MDLGNYIGSKIKYYREEKSLTQDDLAKKLGLGKGTISNYESGYRTPQGNRLFELAEILDININELFPPTIKSEKNISSIYSKLTPPRQQKVYHYAEEQLEAQNKKQTVVTLGKTAAGEPIYQEDIIEEEKEVSAVPAGADVALVVQGDSMEPDFKSGSVVFYKKQPQVENGELAVVHIKDDGITFKKVLFDYDKKKIILRSLNDKYEDKVFDADDVNILGKVIT